jgi:hypothetical protein
MINFHVSSENKPMVPGEIRREITLEVVADGRVGPKGELYIGPQCASAEELDGWVEETVKRLRNAASRARAKFKENRLP